MPGNVIEAQKDCQVEDERDAHEQPSMYLKEVRWVFLRNLG